MYYANNNEALPCENRLPPMIEQNYALRNMIRSLIS